METKQQKIERKREKLIKRLKKLKHDLSVKKRKIWDSIGFIAKHKHQTKALEIEKKIAQTEQKLKELAEYMAKVALE